MYYNGWGVPQDYVQAYTWFNLAASNYDAAQQEDDWNVMLKNRDIVAAKMPPAQIVEDGLYPFLEELPGLSSPGVVTLCLLETGGWPSHPSQVWSKLAPKLAVLSALLA